MGIEIPLHRLYRVQSSKLLRTNPDEFYTELVRTVADVCETKLNALYLVDRSGTRLQLKAAIGLPEEWVNASSEIPIGTHMEAAICGRAAALREPVIASSLEASIWGPYRELAEELGIRAVWSMPFTDSEDRLLGTFATYYATEHDPTIEEMALVERITQEASHIIEMGRLYYEQQAAIQLNRHAQGLAQKLVLRNRPEEVFAAITEDLRRLIGTDVVWLEFMPHIGTGHFFQSEQIFRASPIRWRNSPCWEALETRRPVRRENFTISEVVPTTKPFHLADLLCYPVELDDGYVVITAAWYSPHTMTEREYQVLDLYANLGGIALQNATRYDALRSSYYGMMRGLLISLEVRDFETIAHSRRVVTYTLLLAEALGIPEEELEEVALGAALHDVGKIGLPDTLLGKEGELTPEEYELVKTHPIIGYRMLEHCLPQFPIALDMVRHHHERFDGQGYPDGLTGEEISLPASILAAADAFDVMTTGRPYRPARSILEAREELRICGGTQFHPLCVEAFLSIDVDLLTAVRDGELDRSPFDPPQL